MASIKQTPSGSFQIRVTNKLLRKTLWATFDTYDQAETYAKQLEGLLAQGIVPVGLLERTTPSREDMDRRPLHRRIHSLSRLNGNRTAAIARSDSLEVADYFQAQLSVGEAELAKREKALAALPHDARELARLADIDARKKTYLAARTELLKLKDTGKTQEATALADGGLETVSIATPKD